MWTISKPESFLAAGDRFGLVRSSAHNVFTEIITALHNLIEEYIRWPENYNATEEVCLYPYYELFIK